MVIPFNKEILEYIGNLNGNLNGNLSDQENSLLQILIVNGRKTLDELAVETNMSKRTISIIIASLQEKHVID